MNEVHGDFRGFNPRTHTGCDFWHFFGRNEVAQRFNPRTHTGCDVSEPFKIAFT